MNRVGWRGKGESVWLAWFLAVVCERFAPVCEALDDTERAKSYRDVARRLKKNCDAAAWTGHYYLRGFHDDGAALGDPESEECKIDLNAQTRAAIAGAPRARVRQAMGEADRALGDQKHQILKLLTPAFKHSSQDPGYIRAYPPGVRENGGQYTHAAAWAVWAAAELKDSEKAYRWLRWLNPILHATDAVAAEHYRIEPYVVAGDVYGNPPYEGRGGWSWYTGAAGWLYQCVLIKLLGLTIENRTLRLEPCVPENWGDYEVLWRYRDARYRIHVIEPARLSDQGAVVELDGEVCADGVIPLSEDGEHMIELRPRPRRARSTAAQTSESES